MNPGAIPTMLAHALRGALLLASLLAPLAAEPAEPVAVSFGYSRSMLQGVNEADFRGAIETYARVIAQQSQIPTRTDQPIFSSTAEMEAALRDGSINLLTGPSREILRLPADLLEPDFVVAATSEGTGVEFVLLVRRDRGIQHLAQLRNLTLAIWDSPPTALGFDWLDLLLAHDHLKPVDAFFARVKRCAKPGPAVLPVFFGQIDGAIVTRRAFELLAELNPQLATQLTIIATSPRLQPMLTAFSHRLGPTLRAKVVDAMFSIENTAAGRQVLILYQTESLAFCTPAVLAATRQLIAEHDQLMLAAPATPPPAGAKP